MKKLIIFVLTICIVANPFTNRNVNINSRNDSNIEETTLGNDDEIIDTSNFDFESIRSTLSLFNKRSVALSGEPKDINIGDRWKYDLTFVTNIWDQIYALDYNKTKEKEVIVAVIDTGVDLKHTDLNVITDPLILEDSDFGDFDDDPSDYSGHGTHVAGIIGAKANNGSDNVVGIAPGIKIMPIKMYSNTGVGYNYRMGMAIYHAINNGADVINISSSFDEYNDFVNEALLEAERKNIVVVAISGNDSNHWETGDPFERKNRGDQYSKTVFYPAAAETVLSVGNVAYKNGILGIDDSSNIAGIRDDIFRTVDVVAPGTYIFSSSMRNYNTATVKTGTSMAAPFVAGLAALIRSKYPDMSAAAIREVIRETAYDPGIVIPDGYNRKDTIGSGLVNVEAALNFSPLNSLSIIESSSFKFDTSKYDYLVNVDRGVTSLNFICDAMEGTTFYVNGTTQSNLCNISMPLTKDITVLNFDVELSGVRKTYKFFVKYNQPSSEARIDRIVVATPTVNSSYADKNMNYYIKVDPNASIIKFRIDTKDKIDSVGNVTKSTDKIAMVTFDSETDYIYDEDHIFSVDLTDKTTVLGFKIKTDTGKITTYLMAIIKEGVLSPSPYNPLEPLVITSPVSISIDTDAIVLDYGMNAEPEFMSYNFQATVIGADKRDVVWTLDRNDFVTVDDNGLVTVNADTPVGTGDFSVKLKVQSVVGGAVAEADILFIEKTPLGSVEFLAPYISGYEDGTFRPKNPITRGEVATIFSKILNLKNVDLVDEKFSDVSKDHWAYEYVQSLYETGIFSGYSDGRFLPDAPIKRSEIAQVFTNYWNYYEVEVNATHVIDIPDVDDAFWAADAIHKLYNTRVFPGYLNNAYRPNDETTREELVYMVNRLLGREPLEVEKSTFSDLSLDYYYLGEVEAASQFYINKNNLDQ